MTAQTKSDGGQLHGEGKLTFSGKPFKDVDHFVNNDNHHIFCKYWLPEGDPKALILVVHGFAEHCMKYDPMANMLNQLGFLVFSQDHVGHGESEGYRCDVEDYKIFLRDLLQHIDLMKKKHPSLPLYLFGHSMGGAIALLLAQEHKELFKCCVLSSPMIEKNEVFTPLKLFVLGRLYNVFPHVGVARLDPNQMSRDPGQVQKYKDDPLVYHGAAGMRMAYQLYLLTVDIEKMLSDVSFPFLVLHGDNDRLAEAVGSKNLHRRAKSSDKTIKIFEGCYHELLHETEGIPEQFLADIRDWLKQRM